MGAFATKEAPHLVHDALEMGRVARRPKDWVAFGVNGLIFLGERGVHGLIARHERRSGCAVWRAGRASLYHVVERDRK